MWKKLVAFSALTLILTTSVSAATPIHIDLVDNQYTQLNDLRPSNYISTAVNLIFGASGVAAFIYLLWGGFQWVTSGGDKDSLDKARKRVTTAMVGLAVVFSAYVVLYIIQVLFNISIVQIDFRPLTG